MNALLRPHHFVSQGARWVYWRRIEPPGEAAIKGSSMLLTIVVPAEPVKPASAAGAGAPDSRLPRTPARSLMLKANVLLLLTPKKEEAVHFRNRVLACLGNSS